MRRQCIIPTLLAIVACGSQAQIPPETEADLAKETALLKARQTYYDQLAAATKSQHAASDAVLAVQTAAVTAATALKQAEMTSDLATAAALKGSGLSAAIGKEGSIAFAKSESTLLALQAGTLKLVDETSTQLCGDLQNLQGKVFFAPANYEALVQKSMSDIVQLTALHTSALEGVTEYKTVQMQSVTAVGGALVSAQYLAGGVLAISKLFRSDYSITYSNASRNGLFEQLVSARCASKVVGNVEGQLRLNAANILKTWIGDMAEFAELNDRWSETITQEKARLTASRAAIVADTAKTADEKKKELGIVDNGIKGLVPQEQKLARYRNVAAQIKAYLAAMGASSIYESLIWGQDFLYELGRVNTAKTPQRIELRSLRRLHYAMAVQDATVKETSTFFADKLRTFSTVELSYYIVGTDGTIEAASATSRTLAGGEVKAKDLKFDQVDVKYPMPAVAAN